MRGRWERIRKIGSSVTLGLFLLGSAEGCAIIDSGRAILSMRLPNVEKCGWACAEEVIIARSETPSVEASLERVNTAARLVEIGELMLQALPLSAGSSWPQEMKGTLTLNAQSLSRVMQETYGQRVLYSSTLGFKPSPWTGRALEMQRGLFAQAPGLHDERSYRTGKPSEDDVHAFGVKVLGEGYDRGFDKNLFRLIDHHPGFIPKRGLFSAQHGGTAAEFHTNVMEAVLALSENRDELKQFGDAVKQGEEMCERAYRDVQESAQRIREIRSQTFGNPASAEEAAKKGDEAASAKGLQELEAQFETEKKEYDDAVKAYQGSLQQLSVAVGHIKHQTGAFTAEQRALAINVQAVVDTAQGLLSGTRLLSEIAAMHIPKATRTFGDELKRIARVGGDRAIPHMKRISVNARLLPANLSLIGTESTLLDKESDPYDGLFANRINAPTIAAP